MPDSPVNARAMPTAAAVFVGGAERSGTTLIAAELAGATGYTLLPEAYFLIPWLRGRPKRRSDRRVLTWGMGPQTGIIACSRENPVRAFLSLVDRYEGLVAGGSHGFIEHCPANVNNFGVLTTAFSNAKCVTVVRDPRAVFASLKNTDFGPVSTEAAARAWLAAYHSTRGLDSPSVVRYEDVVRTPKASLLEAVRYILPPSITTLDQRPAHLPARAVSEYTRRDHALVGRPPDASRAEAWRGELSDREVAEIEHWVGPVMSSFGYERALPSMGPPTISRVWSGRAREAIIGHALNPLRRELRWRRFAMRDQQHAN